MLVSEDAAQLLHDLLFGVRLGDRKFLDEQVARRIEHLPFSERELLVPLQHEEVTQHLGDFEHAAGLDLLCVLPVAAVPGLLVDLHLLVAQDPVDLGNHVLADDPPQADGLDVLRRDHDGHVAVDDAEHVELALTARDDLGLHPLNDAYAMSRIHNLLPYLEHACGTGHSGRLRAGYCTGPGPHPSTSKCATPDTGSPRR